MSVEMLDHVKNCTPPNDEALVRIPTSQGQGVVYLTTVGELRAATHVKLPDKAIVLRGTQIRNGTRKEVPIRELAVPNPHCYVDNIPRGSIYVVPKKRLK